MINTLKPLSIGIGLRAPHYRAVLDELPALDFLEVHSENFFAAGGAALHTLQAARAHYPISLHGVGLSLGSADGLREVHVDRLAALVERIEPALVSEHLCWGAIDQLHMADLLPFPTTRATLDLLCERVDALQTRLQRRVLIENISAYLRFHASELSECEFLAELTRRTGCGLLLDINNLYVNAQNFGFDPLAELRQLPPKAIGEIHLAGHSQGEHCLIDTHGSPVCEAVWALYRAALQHCGPVPTLIERDTDIPPLPELLAEAAHARQIMLEQEAACV
ncbi:DUF692 domain-containing protein [Uliginosibacterium flavum]|uniref:UPF0276 protein ABXR19_15360 n=1 Tax=Uliginosibacterium flavum TaxID=1396831 RepID=A0ABV2TNR7_9RHOO